MTVSACYELIEWWAARAGCADPRPAVAPGPAFPRDFRSL